MKVERAQKLRRDATPAERPLWSAVRTHGLAGPYFRRQPILDGFIVDGCCVRARIVVEIDGAHHAEQSAADDHHDQAIERYGFRVLRFSNDDAS
ncbi:MAG: DUF559 domain-containing protein [Anaerolineales bacterium]|nr:DUF559 domain-containing protein [Anaerolineales bacterium]